MKTTERARVSFNYACKQASKCRHEKYQVSCASCPERKTCEIQKRIEKARSKMQEKEDFLRKNRNGVFGSIY